MINSSWKCPGHPHSASNQVSVDFKIALRHFRLICLSWSWYERGPTTIVSKYELPVKMIINIGWFRTRPWWLGWLAERKWWYLLIARDCIFARTNSYTLSQRDTFLNHKDFFIRQEQTSRQVEFRKLKKMLSIEKIWRWYCWFWWKNSDRKTSYVEYWHRKSNICRDLTHHEILLWQGAAPRKDPSSYVGFKSGTCRESLPRQYVLITIWIMTIVKMSSDVSVLHWIVKLMSSHVMTII